MIVNERRIRHAHRSEYILLEIHIQGLAGGALHDFCQNDQPGIAAQLEGRAIDRAALLNAIRTTAAKAEMALVEGVGGFRVPLIPGWDTADLAVDLQLPVILVVGLRLGCINHALLTAEAIRSRGLKLAAWVANTADPRFPHVADNLASLQGGLNAPCWGHVPRLADPNPAAVAAHLNIEL